MLYKYKTFIILLIIIFIIICNNLKRKINNIPIAFSINDDYVYPLIVLLTSILYNSSNKIFYVFYILLAPDLKEISIKKILDFSYLYKNCKINLLYMGEKYSNFTIGYYKSSAVFYRLELSNLIKDVDKIIYLDIDTIVHNDLSQFYNIDMGNYYYMGFPGLDLTIYEINGTRNFINSGVMLINLKKLREVNATNLFKDYYNKYGTKKVDEYLINAVFYNKIGFLPLIYGIPDFYSNEIMLVSPSHFLRNFNHLINYTESQMDNASKNRVITHGCYVSMKWWNMKYENLTYIGRQWLFYASKSIIFDDICKKYKQFIHYCNGTINEHKNV